VYPIGLNPRDAGCGSLLNDIDQLLQNKKNNTYLDEYRENQKMDHE